MLTEPPAAEFELELELGELELELGPELEFELGPELELDCAAPSVIAALVVLVDTADPELLEALASPFVPLGMAASSPLQPQSKQAATEKMILGAKL